MKSTSLLHGKTDMLLVQESVELKGIAGALMCIEITMAAALLWATGI